MRTMIYLLLVFVLLTLKSAADVVSVEMFGAISTSKDAKSAPNVSVAMVNADAFTRALLYGAENNATILIPDEGQYFTLGVNVSSLDYISLQVEGTIIAHPDIDTWNYKITSRKRYWSMFDFADCENIHVFGGGEMNGNGYKWWVASFEVKVGGTRPYILHMTDSKNIVVEDIEFRNSPSYHLYIERSRDILIRYVKVRVDIDEQRKLIEHHGGFWKGVPIFPLNTDGIDVSGINVLIHDCDIENFDDAIAVKAMHGGYKYGNCSENFEIKDIKVSWGVGMTIGAVPPVQSVNCVRNVTFKNVVFEHPFKAVYVKTNPSREGTGIIDNILYENLTINNPVWWSIYIGPQQQKQPDGGGPGCLFYPLSPCPTDPDVSITNLGLKDVTINNPVLLPGIIRCNKENPCKGFYFDNVNVKGWNSWWSYTCENIEGWSRHSKPKPKCFKEKAPDTLVLEDWN